MPIVMPMFDRTTCSISKSQIGFIEFIIQDMMNAWDGKEAACVQQACIINNLCFVLGFIDMPELIQLMQYNCSQWKLFEEQGINTLNDIKRKQLSITNESHSALKLDEIL